MTDLRWTLADLEAARSPELAAMDSVRDTVRRRAMVGLAQGRIVEITDGERVLARYYPDGSVENFWRWGQ